MRFIRLYNTQSDIKGTLSHKIYIERHLLLKYIFQRKVALETYSSYTHPPTYTHTHTHARTHNMRIISCSSILLHARDLSIWLSFKLN
jgi:hypothetical protein